jgi:hypothetical protein
VTPKSLCTAFISGAIAAIAAMGCTPAKHHGAHGNLIDMTTGVTGVDVYSGALNDPLHANIVFYGNTYTLGTATDYFIWSTRLMTKPLG